MANSRILIVEDERIVARDVQNRLTALGYSVPALASSGEQAIKQAEEIHPNLVLMDIRLKGEMDGVEAAEQIRHRLNIPVVYLTAHSDDDTLQRAKVTEPFGYVLKPFEERELHIAIEMALYRHRLERKLVESERWLSTILMSITDAVIATDGEGHVTLMNPTAQALTGWGQRPALGQPLEKVFNVVVGKTGERAEHPVARGLREGTLASLGNDTLLVGQDGTKAPVEYSVAPIRGENGEVVGAVVVFRDITERKRAEEALRKAHDELERRVEERTVELFEANVLLEREITEHKRTEEILRESEERYALAARGANDGLWDWDLRTNEVYFSPRWKSMLGYEENEIGNSPDEWLSRVHPDDLDQVKVDIAAHFEGLARHFENEHRLLHRDGTYRWMLSRGLAIRDESGRAYRMAGSQTDTTERKRAEEQLLHDAFHDALTGLPNRALFMDRLGHALECAECWEDSPFAVLFLDFDRFKMVNDSLGHGSGDQLLIAIARRLRTCLRPADTVARLGGDEFAVLIENIRDVADAERAADWIRGTLTRPFNLDGHEIFITASIGIVLPERAHNRPEDVLRDADIAMYRAKALGKARYVVFAPAMRARVWRRMETEADLWRALERQELRIHYQPIVALDTGRMTGFEALLRWQHPERGLLSPAEFVPLAEETGLIIPIDRWVLREACRQMGMWQAQFPTAPPLSISVNLSARQLGQPDLVEQIAQTVHDTDFDARHLKLELTESSIMDSPEPASVMLSQLRTLGIQLHIDDFGMGHSSLGYLQQLPANAIKIDRAFVSRIGMEDNALEIVQTIVMLARDIGLDVIAEGIETTEQLAQLTALGCVYGQGYLFSRPVDSQAAGALIAEFRRDGLGQETFAHHIICLPII